jgi:hypothetical protein
MVRYPTGLARPGFDVRPIPHFPQLKLEKRWWEVGVPANPAGDGRSCDAEAFADLRSTD